MKKLIFTLTLLVAFLFPAISANADDTVNLTPVGKDEIKDPEYFKPMPNKRRSGAKPILCVISDQGLYIPGVASEDIILYEVYSEEGEILASFLSQSEFISYTSSYDKTLVICLHLQDYVLQGVLYK